MNLRNDWLDRIPRPKGQEYTQEWASLGEAYRNKKSESSSFFLLISWSCDLLKAKQVQCIETISNLFLGWFEHLLTSVGHNDDICLAAKAARFFLFELKSLYRITSSHASPAHRISSPAGRKLLSDVTNTHPQRSFQKISQETSSPHSIMSSPNKSTNSFTPHKSEIMLLSKVRTSLKQSPGRSGGSRVVFQSYNGKPVEGKNDHLPPTPLALAAPTTSGCSCALPATPTEKRSILQVSEITISKVTLDREPINSPSKGDPAIAFGEFESSSILNQSEQDTLNSSQRSRKLNLPQSVGPVCTFGQRASGDRCFTAVQPTDQQKLKLALPVSPRTAWSECSTSMAYTGDRWETGNKLPEQPVTTPIPEEKNVKILTVVDRFPLDEPQQSQKQKTGTPPREGLTRDVSTECDQQMEGVSHAKDISTQYSDQMNPKTRPLDLSHNIDEASMAQQSLSQQTLSNFSDDEAYQAVRSTHTARPPTPQPSACIGELRLGRDFTYRPPQTVVTPDFRYVSHEDSVHGSSTATTAFHSRDSTLRRASNITPAKAEVETPPAKCIEEDCDSSCLLFSPYTPRIPHASSISNNCFSMADKISEHPNTTISAYGSSKSTLSGVSAPRAKFLPNYTALSEDSEESDMDLSMSLSFLASRKIRLPMPKFVWDAVDNGPVPQELVEPKGRTNFVFDIPIADGVPPLVPLVSPPHSGVTRHAMNPQEELCLQDQRDSPVNHGPKVGPVKSDVTGLQQAPKLEAHVPIRERKSSSCVNMKGIQPPEHKIKVGDNRTAERSHQQKFQTDKNTTERIQPHTTNAPVDHTNHERAPHAKPSEMLAAPSPQIQAPQQPPLPVGDAERKKAKEEAAAERVKQLKLLHEALTSARRSATGEKEGQDLGSLSQNGNASLIASTNSGSLDASCADVSCNLNDSLSLRRSRSPNSLALPIPQFSIPHTPPPLCRVADKSISRSPITPAAIPEPHKRPSAPPQPPNKIIRNHHGNAEAESEPKEIPSEKQTLRRDNKGETTGLKDGRNKVPGKPDGKDRGNGKGSRSVESSPAKPKCDRSTVKDTERKRSGELMAEVNESKGRRGRSAGSGVSDGKDQKDGKAGKQVKLGRSVSAGSEQKDKKGKEGKAKKEGKEGDAPLTALARLRSASQALRGRSPDTRSGSKKVRGGSASGKTRVRERTASMGSRGSKESLGSKDSRGSRDTQRGSVSAVSLCSGKEADKCIGSAGSGNAPEKDRKSGNYSPSSRAAALPEASTLKVNRPILPQVQSSLDGSKGSVVSAPNSSIHSTKQELGSQMQSQTSTERVRSGDAQIQEAIASIFYSLDKLVIRCFPMQYRCGCFGCGTGGTWDGQSSYFVCRASTAEAEQVGCGKKLCVICGKEVKDGSHAAKADCCGSISSIPGITETSLYFPAAAPHSTIRRFLCVRLHLFLMTAMSGFEPSILKKWYSKTPIFTSSSDQNIPHVRAECTASPITSADCKEIICMIVNGLVNGTALYQQATCFSYIKERIITPVCVHQISMNTSPAIHSATHRLAFMLDQREKGKVVNDSVKITTAAPPKTLKTSIPRSPSLFSTIKTAIVTRTASVRRKATGR